MPTISFGFILSYRHNGMSGDNHIVTTSDIYGINYDDI